MYGQQIPVKYQISHLTVLYSTVRKSIDIPTRVCTCVVFPEQFQEWQRKKLINTSLPECFTCQLARVRAKIHTYV